jgi:hypothetical protein
MTPRRGMTHAEAGSLGGKRQKETTTHEQHVEWGRKGMHKRWAGHVKKRRRRILGVVKRTPSKYDRSDYTVWVVRQRRAEGLTDWTV